MKIPPGKVVPTAAKCQGRIIMVYEGKGYKVMSVDPESRIVEVVDEKGKPMSVFYPRVAEEPTATKLESLKRGQTVGLDLLEGPSGWTKVVRADRIKVE